MKVWGHVVVVSIVVWSAVPLRAGNSYNELVANGVGRLSASDQGSLPHIMSRVHTVGNVRLTVSNAGVIGNEFDTRIDPCTGLPAPSFEYPAKSGLEYLHTASLWVGAVRDQDTLVSVGWDGWQFVYEMFPAPYPQGVILERTNRKTLAAPRNSYCPDVRFSGDAVSEQDFVATYFDTLVDTRLLTPDPTDGRAHKPIGLGITQKSYAWSFSQDQGLILVEHQINNISSETLTGVYVGMLLDQHILDRYTFDQDGTGRDDDMLGFLFTVPSSSGAEYLDTVGLVWHADNDGEPRGVEFGPSSPNGVAGLRLLSPRGQMTGTLSFNWWKPSSQPSLDWGPNKRESDVQYVHGNLGTPRGDRAKYQILSNGEVDYDQAEAALNHDSDGWLPPPADRTFAVDLADGKHVNCLLSVGPFDILADSAKEFVWAFVVAENFHTVAENWRRFFDPRDPSPYYRNLDFENLTLIAQTAGWVYDTPGFDTDGDGHRGKYRLVKGDTVYYEGDGVPDYRVSPAPPAPRLSYSTRQGRIVLNWNGQASETTVDPFTVLEDFEGYRVYLSRTGRLGDYRLLAQRDNRNWSRYHWQPTIGRWRMKEPPFTLDSLRSLFDSISVADYGYRFHPDSFDVGSVDKAFLEIVFDERDPTVLDSNYYYFQPYDANAMVEDLFYIEQVEKGDEVTGIIRKLYPDAPADSVAYREDGNEYYPYYEYEFAIDGLQVAEPIFLSVTAFDFGNPAVGQKSLESSPTANAVEVWPINSVEVVKTERPKPGVYPNPYRLVDSYNAAGWENPRGLEPDPERARRMTFYNVPDTCIVSIWSLDGDLIKRLEHKADPANSEASVVRWNLITRNTQAIKTGIYIYSIESRLGTDVGKLVIIK